MTTDTAVAPTRTPVKETPFTHSILEVLDQLRKSGPMQTIVFPPYPELLRRLQEALAEEEPDLNEVSRIASSDVAMSMALMKAANSPLYAVGQPVQTIGQAMNILGLDNTAAVMTGFLAQRAVKISSAQLARFWSAPPNERWPWPSWHARCLVCRPTLPTRLVCSATSALP